MYREFSESKLELNGKCPVCSSQCYKAFDYQQTSLIVCPTCGRYRYGAMAELFLNDSNRKSMQLSYKVSYHLRTVSERAYGKRDNSLYPIYDYAEIESMAETPDPSVSEKLQMLLMYLASLTLYPGQQILFDAKQDYSVLCAQNAAEAEFYQPALEEQGFVAAVPTTDRSRPCFLTSLGWKELERLHRSGADSSLGFIAMWFEPSQDAVKLTIDTAIRKSGYDPIRIDEVEHVNRIDDEIIARIRQSKFLVADLTGQRNGVYFEAGFMLGLGRPVIWLCHQSELSKVHFDTRQYNTIVYEDTESLQTKLQFRIEAILGKGPRPSES